MKRMRNHKYIVARSVKNNVKKGLLHLLNIVLIITQLEFDNVKI